MRGCSILVSNSILSLFKPPLSKIVIRPDYFEPNVSPLHHLAHDCHLTGTKKWVEHSISFFARIHQNFPHQLGRKFRWSLLISVPVLSLDGPDIFFVCIMEASSGLTIGVFIKPREGEKFPLRIVLAYVQAMVVGGHEPPLCNDPELILPDDMIHCKETYLVNRYQNILEVVPA